MPHAAQAQAAKVYSVKTPEGETKLPIVDGTYYTDMAHNKWGTGTFVIAFYDDNDVIQTPGGGTVTPTASPIQGQWHAPSYGDTIIDLTAAGPEATYLQPVFNGRMSQGRIVVSGVSAGSATYMIAQFWRD